MNAFLAAPLLPIEMSLQDLANAKRRLGEKRLTLCLVKDGKIIFETDSHGISGFLEAVEKFGLRLERVSVADRIAGKAVALLCVYAKVKAVYARTLSKEAKRVFEENHVYHEWDYLVEQILGTDNSEICPFEKLAANISNPSRAYKRLKALETSLKNG